MNDLADLLREAGAHDAAFTADDVAARVRARRRRRSVVGAGAATLVIAVGIGAFALTVDEDAPTTVAGPPPPTRVDMSIEHRIDAGTDFLLSTVLFDGGVAYLEGTAQAHGSLVVHDLESGERRVVATERAPYSEWYGLRGSGPALAWVAQPFDPRDGFHDRPWRIEVLIGAERRTVAESARDGYVDIELSWPWLAWTEATMRDDATEIHVLNVATGDAHLVPAEGGLVAVDGDDLWLRRDDEILRRPIEGTATAEVVVSTTNLRDIAVAGDVLAWMTEAPGGRGAWTLHVRGADGVARSVTMHHTPRRTPWGNPLLVGDVLAWDEPERGFVAAPVVDPRRTTTLAQTAYASGLRADVEGDRLAWTEGHADGTNAIYVARLRVEAAPAEK